MNSRLDARVTSLEMRGCGRSPLRLVFRSLVSPGDRNEGKLYSATSIGKSGRLVRAKGESEADFLMRVGEAFPSKVDYRDIPDHLLEHTLSTITRKILSHPNYEPDQIHGGDGQNGAQ